MRHRLQKAHGQIRSAICGDFGDGRVGYLGCNGLRDPAHAAGDASDGPTCCGPPRPAASATCRATARHRWAKYCKLDASTTAPRLTSEWAITMPHLSDGTTQTPLRRPKASAAVVRTTDRCRAIPLLAVAALLVLSGAAEAKGGHARGRTRGTAFLSAPTPSPSAATATTLSAPAVLPSAAVAPRPGPATIPGSALRSLQALPSPPATPPPAPMAVIGAPAPRLPPIAPLSPPDTTPTTTLTTGGSARTDSAPGGGGKTLQDCLSFWDAQTHMSKTEWKEACARSLHRLENLKVENIGLPRAKP